MQSHDDDDMNYGNLEDKPLDLMVLLCLEACGELDGVWSTNTKA